MTKLPPDLEALMPEPVILLWQDHPSGAMPIRGYSADQVRAAMLGATERGQADTVRLDWIVRQADEFSCSVIVDAPGDGDYIVHGMDGYGQGKTPREAIDNAMRFNGAAAIRGDGRQT